MRRSDTIEVRAYMTIKEALLLDILSKKLNKPKGKLLSELLEESITWTDKVKNFERLAESL